MFDKDLNTMNNIIDDNKIYNGENKTKTILIVDDDVINRKVLGKIFSSDYAVEEAQKRFLLQRILVKATRPFSASSTA